MEKMKRGVKTSADHRLRWWYHPRWCCYFRLVILAQTPEPARDVPESRQSMGINLSPYRMEAVGVPIDEQIVGDLENLGAKWMRFEFRAKGTVPNTYIPVEDYTVAADNLAAHGIEILGLIDYTTLPWAKETWSTTDYREKFISRTVDLVGEFKDKVGAWEIWNEEDLGYGPGDPGGDTYVSPLHYAYLLGGDPTADEITHPWAAMGVYEAIKSQDPEAIVSLGGLSNAWKGEDGRGAGHYLAELYQRLSDLGYEAGSWPFDVVAVHPYYGHNPDPSVYLFDGGDYILRANLWTVMDANGDGDKRFWITEIGWNTNDKQWACIFPERQRGQPGLLPVEKLGDFPERAHQRERGPGRQGVLVHVPGHRHTGRSRHLPAGGGAATGRHCRGSTHACHAAKSHTHARCRSSARDQPGRDRFLVGARSRRLCAQAGVLHLQVVRAGGQLCLPAADREGCGFSVSRWPKLSQPACRLWAFRV